MQTVDGRRRTKKKQKKYSAIDNKTCTNMNWWNICCARVSTNMKKHADTRAHSSIDRKTKYLLINSDANGLVCVSVCVGFSIFSVFLVLPYYRFLRLTNPSPSFLHFVRYSLVGFFFCSFFAEIRFLLISHFRRNRTMCVCVCVWWCIRKVFTSLSSRCDES